MKVIRKLSEINESVLSQIFCDHRQTSTMLFIRFSRQKSYRMVGFDAKNKQSFSQKFICPYCNFLLREPVQLGECGHRLCHSCVNSAVG